MQNLSKEQVKTILSNAPAGSDYGKIVQGLADKGYVLEGYNDQPAPKQDGFVQALAKDAVGTLVAKPVMRGTELATRVFAPNSMAAEGFGQMADRGESQTANIPLIGDIEVGQAKEFGEGGGRELASDALKTASYLFPYGKAAKAITGATGSKIAGNVASGVAGGYSADVGYNLADENKTIGESFIPGLGTALGAAIPLAGPVVRASGRGVAKAGEKLVDAVIPASTREAQILQTYQAKNPFFQRVRDILSGVDNSPTTAGKTAVRTKAGQTFSGLFGTKSQIGVQARRAAESLWNDVISPRLKASEQAVDLDGFFAKVQDDIITNNPEVSRQNALLKALDSFKEEYAGMRVVSLEKLQKLKEGWAEFIPEKAYRGENISGAANQVRKLLANESRQTIYSQLGDDIRQAYFDYGNLQGLQKMGIVSMTGQKLKGGTGGFISELLSQSVTPIGTVGGQVIYRLGKGMEFIGELGAKNLAEALGIKGLKFPGDKLIDDVQKRLQEFKAPRNTQINQIPTNTKSIAISDTIPQTSKKVKGETPSKLRKNSQAGFISTGFKNEGNLTTKILKDLEGKTTVSKQYIQDLAGVDSKTGLVKEMLPVGIKKPEAEIFAQVLKDEGDKISVSDFAQKIKAELLPLKSRVATQRTYDNVVLPSELRGNVKGYKENLYESPIKTSAGENSHYPEAKNYFGHTRIEDMVDNKTRRVIEVQSDLYQKGNLEKEVENSWASLEDAKKYFQYQGKSDSEALRMAKLSFENQGGDVRKLQQYNDPTAHFRMVREEIKKAAQDGKTKLQFPTGETAMKIEGLGQGNTWHLGYNQERGGGIRLTTDALKVGEEVVQGSDKWIITDVLGDGKFKAVPKDRVGMAFEYGGGGLNSLQSDARGNMRPLSDWQETFDISGKVDTNNPIYKFYEKDVQKYLNKFGGKRVVDDKGVSWIEIPITKEQGISPVDAFGKIQISPLYAGAGLSLAGVAGAGAIKKRKK